MANDGKIYITISDKRMGSAGGVGEGSEEKEKKGTNIGKWAVHRLIHFAEAQGKQAVSYTISNIGNFSGNYQQQRDVEHAISLINMGISLTTSAIAGAKVGGFIGAAVAVTLSWSSMVANETYAMYTESFNLRKTNRNIEMMRNRLGMQGLTDGSRTGGY